MINKFYATGRRKTAVAKVWVKAGKGTITINGQDIEAWLGGHESIKSRLRQPMMVTKTLDKVDVEAKVVGSGYSAQADAVRHGLTRALTRFDLNFRALLKPKGLLTRDSRKVERKKYGRHKARRSPQFSKR